MKEKKLLFYCFLTATALTASSSLTWKKKDRKKDNLNPNISPANLCTKEDNTASMHCVCVGGAPPANTTSAECWIFTGVAQDHSIWSLFATQPHLTELKFMVRPQGQFTFIPTKGLRHLTYLSKLQIMYANINEIQPYAFANSSSLKELILTRNQIVALDSHAFAHMTNLSEVSLEENRIAEFKRDVFVNLPKLRKLLVAHNNLSVIEEGTFRHLAHLFELVLEANCINVLTRDTFTGLGQLVKLGLAHNQITILGDFTFSELWILEDLNLEHNQIEFISNRVFAGLNHLKRLSLSHNHLNALSGIMLGEVSTLFHLDLRDNYLSTIDLDSIQPILQNLKNKSGQFYISDNKFICDCRLTWLHFLRNETTNIMLKRTLDEIVCYMEIAEMEPLKTMTVKTTSPPEDYKYGTEEGDYSNNDIYDQQQESLLNYVTVASERDLKKQLFFEIPLKELPCTYDEHTTETSRNFLHNSSSAYTRRINLNDAIKKLVPFFSFVYYLNLQCF